MTINRRALLNLAGASLVTGCGGGFKYNPILETVSQILPNPVGHANVGQALSQLSGKFANAPLWTGNRGWSQQARQVHRYIKDSWAEGLQPTSYLPTDFNAGLGQPSAERDLALSAAALKLVNDIKFGRTRRNYSGAVNIVADLARNSNQDAELSLASLGPADGPYRQLRNQARKSLWNKGARSKGFTSLETTMEKLRSSGFPNISGQVIVVNIPAFDLHAYKDSKPYLRSRVIVGKEGRQTPVGRDYITNLKFSPDWTPPRSIINRDLVPALQEDASSLDPLAMEIFVRGKRIENPSEYNWRNVNPDSVTMRQPPGQNPILGGVRFSMQNTRAIYLHDTSAQPLFDSTLRTASSGCVRIEQSKELASWLLREDGQAKEDTEITDLMSRDKSIFLQLNQRVRVEMLYLTAWINDRGVFTLYPDIYDRDTRLIAALASA